SPNSIGRPPSALSRTSDTSAIPNGCRDAEPAKITSSGLRALTAFADCSPNTHRTPSAILLLPLPLGPTTTTMPGCSSVVVRGAKDLKPERSRRLRNNRPGACQGRQSGGESAELGRVEHQPDRLDAVVVDVDELGKAQRAGAGANLAVVKRGRVAAASDVLDQVEGAHRPDEGSQAVHERVQTDP